MELLQLRYFLTAAEYQHMTKAAEHLQIAQPALSQAIHRLEAELGVPLFERKSRSVELNEAGRLLQKRLIPIVSALDRIPGELRADQYHPFKAFGGLHPDYQPDYCLQGPAARCKFPAVPG